MSGWTAEELSPQTNGSLTIWCSGGCTKIKRLQEEKPWELNISSQVRLQAGFLPPKESVCSSLALPFLILPGNLHHKGGRQLCEPWQSQHPPATKGLDDGSDGSTNSPYFIVICPQTSCTEGQEGGLGLKTKDRTAQLTLLSLHTQYSVYSSLYLTLGTVPNCIRKTEIYVMGTKYTNLRAGLKPVAYFSG